MATEKGIAVTIKGFIPVDPHDLEGHRNAIDAVVKARNGELAALDDAQIGFRVEDFRADPINRRPKGE